MQHTFGLSEADVWRRAFIDADVADDVAAAFETTKRTLTSMLTPDVVALLDDLATFDDASEAPTSTTHPMLFSAKLDWLLASRAHFASTSSVVSNRDGALSDHCCLTHEFDWK